MTRKKTHGSRHGWRRGKILKRRHRGEMRLSMRKGRKSWRRARYRRLLGFVEICDLLRKSKESIYLPLLCLCKLNA
jgi:hypothetical protein